MNGPLQLTPGMVFARDYRIVRPLAEGGMGSVYVVEQLSTGKERALKTMHADLVQNAKSRERFTQEARAASLIESDHVVDVVAAGVDEATGTPWLAMEMLKGEELSKVIKRRGRLPVDEVLEIFKQLCHALGAAHRAGMVHRDLKPENIFLATPRRSDVAFTVKVLDFGIAKLVQEAKQGAQATGVIGSPLWMAPEQISAGLIRPSTDVWPLGLMAFQLLTGKHYLRAANQETATLSELLMEMAMNTIDPASVRAAQFGVGETLPPGFDAWFARCVVREPEMRFQDANQVIEALVPVLTGRGQAQAMGGFTQQPHTGYPQSAPPPPYATPNPQQMYPGQPVPQQWNAVPGHYAAAPKRSSAGLVIGIIGGVVVLSLVGAVVAYAMNLGGIADAINGNSTNTASGGAPASSAQPFAAGQSWIGSYVCTGATTDLTIRITAATGNLVNGVFDFRAPASGEAGQYALAGTFDPGSRHMVFEAGAWIVPVPGVTPTSVNVDVPPDGATFTGALPYPGCLPFVLRRQ